MTNHICDNCHKPFRSLRSEENLLGQMNQEIGPLSTHHIICNDCYALFMDWYKEPEVEEQDPITE